MCHIARLASRVLRLPTSPTMTRIPTRTMPRYALVLGGELLWGAIEFIALCRSRLARR